jgi:predicted O-methyltransferase YrrM
LRTFRAAFHFLDMTDLSYRGKPYPQTHPVRLATIARLYGLEPAPVDHCRVLEIGCADGVNALAMASQLPRSEFVALDLDEISIQGARRFARESGIRNLALHAMDLCDVAASFGEFDYIVAHGMYSWLPAAARDFLLTLCRERLRPNGVAFVSFAVYPGCFLEQPLRGALQRVSGDVPPENRIAAAREFGELVSRHAPTPGLRALLEEECATIARAPDWHLLGDHLVESFHPVYFADFIRHTASHHLRYLAEAELGDLGESGIEPAALEAIRPLAHGDPLAHQQYLDLLRFRRYRQALLVQERAAPLPQPDPAILAELFAGAPLRRVDSAHAARPPGVEEFENLNLSTRFATNTPALKAALHRLAASWPSYLPCRELDAPHAILLDLFAAGVLDLRTLPPALDALGAARPCAPALVRAQAAAGRAVASLLHYEVNLEDPFSRALLAMLDGRRTPSELAATAGCGGQLVEHCLGIFRRHGLLKASR